MINKSIFGSNQTAENEYRNWKFKKYKRNVRNITRRIKKKDCNGLDILKQKYLVDWIKLTTKLEKIKDLIRIIVILSIFLLNL